MCSFILQIVYHKNDHGPRLSKTNNSSFRKIKSKVYIEKGSSD